VGADRKLLAVKPGFHGCLLDRGRELGFSGCRSLSDEAVESRWRHE
jgi:hypothetical protein